MLVMDPDEVEDAMEIIENMELQGNFSAVSDGPLYGIKFSSGYDERVALDELVFLGFSVFPYREVSRKL